MLQPKDKDWLNGYKNKKQQQQKKTNKVIERETYTTKITLSIKDLIQIWRRNQKLYRQTKAKRIQNHQTSSSTNAKGSSLDRKHRKDLEKQTQNNKVNGNGIIFINNNLKCKWVQCSNQKTKAGWMDTKTKPLYMLCTRDPPQNGDTYRLKVKGWKNISHPNRDQKKAGVPILISDKIDFILFLFFFNLKSFI